MDGPQDYKVDKLFNWQEALLSVDALVNAPSDAFASSREAERALSIYNRAIEHMKGDNQDIALIALEKLTSTYPLFSEAAIYYGLSLASLRKYDRAEEQFEKALLSDPSPEQRDILQKLLLQARYSRKNVEAQEESRRDSEKKLLSIRANLAQSGILERAAGSDSDGQIRMASAKEIEQVKQQIQEAGGSEPFIATEKKHKNLSRIILTIIIIALALFALIYFLVLPQVRENKERAERLDWLEKRIESEAENDADFQTILDQYNEKFSK